MTVLQSAAGVAAVAVFAAVVDFAAVPAAVFAATGLGFAGHTPFTVMTAASGGTAAEVSGGGAGRLRRGRCAWRGLSPSQRTQQNTHQPTLTHKSFPPGLVHQKVENAKHQILAQRDIFARVRAANARSHFSYSGVILSAAAFQAERRISFLRGFERQPNCTVGPRS